MGGPANIGYATATGDITTQMSFVRSVVLTAGSGATGTVVVKAGGSSGTTLLALSAVQATSISADLCGAAFEGGVHVTLSGAGASVSVVYT